MLEKITQLFLQKSLLDVSTEECMEMLQLDLQMFTEARETIRQREDNHVNIDIYKYDKKVNKLERSVRKKIFTHLAVGSRLDLNRGLILINIVIDLERIGDYTKNMVELAKARHEPLNPGPWKKKIDQIETDIVKSFKTLIELFSTSDPDKETAREIMSNLNEYNKVFDDNMVEIIRGQVKKLSPSDAATLVLYMRYLKRIGCHLKNVASSIVNPMHRIGFKPKKEKSRIRTKTIKT